jgi:hypothetical protein
MRILFTLSICVWAHGCDSATSSDPGDARPPEADVAPLEMDVEPPPEADAEPRVTDAAASPTDAAALPEDAATLPPDAERPPALDLLETRVVFDVSALTATATVTLVTHGLERAQLSAGGLSDLELRTTDGAALDFTYDDGQLTLPVVDGEPVTFVATYGYAEQGLFEGLLPGRRSTLTWPDHCGNLFPCSTDPADGLRLSVEVVGLAAEDVSVSTPPLAVDAPPYVAAYALGPYTWRSYGTTPSGTEVGAWLRPGEADEADRGLEGLVEVFGWYEDHLGPYPFGDRAGAVSVEWGPSAVGGMEHHPFWHVSGALGDPLVQAHEAAHGWFGDGVRLRCWEDMVLSEGVADYLAGAAAALQGDFFVWSTYRQAAEAAVARSPLDVARPDGCNLLEPASTWYFSGIPYKKGALFLRALAQRVGDDALLDALGVFFRAHVGRAAGVDDLLAVIRSETDYDPTDCADTWLRQPALPEADPCP